jgi:hypothetical protein
MRVLPARSSADQASKKKNWVVRAARSQSANLALSQQIATLSKTGGESTTPSTGEQ